MAIGTALAIGLGLSAGFGASAVMNRRRGQSQPSAAAPPPVPQVDRAADMTAAFRARKQTARRQPRPWGQSTLLGRAGNATAGATYQPQTLLGGGR